MTSKNKCKENYMNKIIFLDLDGTLLNDNKQITPLTLQTLEAWTNKGHKLVYVPVVHWIV